jgi:hypothetical protein
VLDTAVTRLEPPVLTATAVCASRRARRMISRSMLCKRYYRRSGCAVEERPAPSVAPDETNRRLLELDTVVAAREIEYDPFSQ